MTQQEITKALRWLANETEFIFAADTLRKASDELERLQAENATLKRALELACDYLADNNASKVDWQKHFTEKAKEDLQE